MAEVLIDETWILLYVAPNHKLLFDYCSSNGVLAWRREKWGHVDPCPTIIYLLQRIPEIDDEFFCLICLHIGFVSTHSKLESSIRKNSIYFSIVPSCISWNEPFADLLGSLRVPWLWDLPISNQNVYPRLFVNIVLAQVDWSWLLGPLTVTSTQNRVTI